MRWVSLGAPAPHSAQNCGTTNYCKMHYSFVCMYSACTSLYRLCIQFFICMRQNYIAVLWKLIDSVEFVSPSDGMHWMSLHVRIGECEERCLNTGWAEKGMLGATEPIRWTPVRGSERGVTGLMCSCALCAVWDLAYFLMHIAQPS